MKLSGTDYDKLLRALVDAFDLPAFTIMLRVELDRQLSHMASENAPFPEIVASVIDASEREGWTDALVQGARKANPDNRQLADLAANWPPPPVEPSEDEGTDHTTRAQRARIAMGIGIVLVAAAATLVLVVRGQLGSGTTPTAAGAAAPTQPAVACRDGVAPAVSELDDMVSIAAGTFVMGDNGVERPQHEVNLGGFLIDRFEVTNLQYQRYLIETGTAAPETWAGTNFPTGQTAFQPVVDVTWHEANAYCASVGKRLPTEAEWEYACRGPAGYIFPWGNESSPALANTQESTCGQALSVGSYSPDGDSAFGVADLVGNVMEWVGSIKRPYPFDPTASAPHPDLDSQQVPAIRGGSWSDPQSQGSCTVRGAFQPEARLEFVGFRCARDASAAP